MVAVDLFLHSYCCANSTLFNHMLLYRRPLLFSFDIIKFIGCALLGVELSAGSFVGRGLCLECRVSRVLT